MTLFQFSSSRIFSLFVAALLFSSLPPATHAQLPPPESSGPASQEVAASDADPEAIRERIASLRREIEALPEDGDPALRDILVQTKAAAGFHLDALQAADTARIELEAARKEKSDWHGFTEKPPYSILLQDELRDKLAWCDETERGLRSLGAGFQKDLERLQTELRAYSQAERRNREAAEKASGTAAAAALEREAALSNASARLARERAARHKTRLDVMRTKVAEIAEIRELTERKLATIGDNVSFSKEELDAVLQRINDERREMARMQDGRNRSDEASATLNNWMSEYFTASTTFWETRFAIHHTPADEIPKHAATLKEILSNLSNWSAIVETAITGIDDGFGGIAPEELRVMASRLRGMQRLVERTLGDIGYQRNPGAKAMISRIRDKALDIWNAELYLVEETEIVEVAGITGTIKQVGIRASLITHFDGIDTLIPNSVLLENQLTNWTYSDTVLRGEIQVGVAYGSPTRQVSKLLVAAATGHGLVMKDPAPYVRFDNFGDDSLLFTLLYWSDTDKIGRLDLASDLRFMIDKSLAEAGIVIAYPQRDVHLDAQQPLRVELSRPKPVSVEPSPPQPDGWSNDEINHL